MIKSEQTPSLLHKWCLYWDDDASLWFHSSDVGRCVWIKDDKGQYLRESFKGDKREHLIRTMPQEMFEMLPSWIQKKGVYTDNNDLERS